MDISSYLQHFESRLSSYTGDDPLDAWDKFVEYLEQRVPSDGGSGMSLVLDRLVQRFLNVEQYANDLRFVNHCIRCASYYSDPVALYTHVFSKGVGTRTAALYVAWAQHCERRGLNEEAEAVYQNATENRAQPVDTVLSEHRQFQARTRTPTPGSAGSQNPLQNSLLTNQMSSHREAPNKDSVECPAKPPVYKTVVTVSRSETSIPSSQSSAPSVSEYLKEELLCDGSELCFEEVRAGKYFEKLKENQPMDSREMMEKMIREAEEGIQSIRSTLEQVNHDLEDTTHQDVFHPAEPEEKLNMSQGGTDNLSHITDNLSHITDNLSHITPNNSLGFVQATPSRVLPSPTVNTREALDVIMDMFQAPTLLEDPFSSTSLLRAAERGFDPRYPGTGVSTLTLTSTAPFTVFQDETDKENSAAAPSKPIRALAEIPASIKPNQETPPEMTPDESTMWGARYNSLSSLAACPNSTSDFNMLAQFVSTPFTHKGTFTFYEEDHENDCDGGDAEDEAFVRRQPKKLSPIMEQSPSNDAAFGQRLPSSAAHGTIVGEGLASAPPCLTSSSSITMVQPPPPAVLSFRDQTLCPTDASSVHGTPITDASSVHGTPITDASSVHGTPITDASSVHGTPITDASSVHGTPSTDASSSHGTTITASSSHGTTITDASSVHGTPSTDASSSHGTTITASSSHGTTITDASSVHGTPSTASSACWDVYARPEPDASVGPRREAFTIMEDWDQPASPERVQRPVADVPMSPECAVQPDWLPDPDAFASPRRLCADVPMSPVQPPRVSAEEDELMMSPDVRAVKPHAADVSMNAAAEEEEGGESAAVRLVSDPWDDELISDLLASLHPPLSAHPRCITWPCKVPNISPKTTISMGKASLRVDRVLGEGAFATVYQATDPVTSERTVLKVQKPANPWEFYVHTQLDARLRPDLRQLFGSVRSAHLFHDGSVLLGELHDHGTLLNAVNIYKTQSEKVMPQPLVMYFAVCILHTVEQLHAVHVVHADIKPDNFLLGERFLDSQCFDPESLDHGLVLIDLGQSIDMDLFPEGTAFTTRCLTSGFQCTEMLSGKPWSYQTDYFGVAGTVHCLLFGTYMTVTNEGGVWKTNGAFRRNPHSDLWRDFFRALLNVPDGGGGSPPPSLRSLRCSLASTLRQNYGNRLSSLKNRMMVLLLESRRTARR